jgi:predicted MFS family arabinose efflux permease
MQRTAQIWLVYSITDSPFLVGMVGVCQFTPMLLFTLFAGVIVDRVASKRNLLLITQLLFMLQALALTLLTFFDLVTYQHIFLLSALFGIVQTFDMPTRQAFFSDLVGKQNIMNAVSLNSTIVNLAKIIGPALSGVAIINLGVGFCFLINTLSYLTVLISLFCIHTKSKAVTHEHKDIMQEMKEGIQYIRHEATLKINVILMAIVCTFAMNNDVIIPVFTKEVLHMGSSAYTALMSAAGIGAFLGAIFMSARAKNGIKKSLFLGSLFLTIGIQISMFFIGNYYIALLAIGIIGFANLVFMNMGNSIFQLTSEEQYRGRVMSVYAFLNQGSTPIGNFYAGILMEHTGGLLGFPGCGIMALFLFTLTYAANKNKIMDWVRN